ncbi:MAG: MBL fold metallo-hydrolase, partial [Wenzhouxiangellaceae bacterium]
ETTLVIDGFFSRPPLRKVVFGRIEPDRERIRQALEQAGITSVAAVIPLHTHYDHALDSAEVARLTGAQLVGSASAAQLGRGAGLAESGMSIVSGRETFSFGDFRVTLVPTIHLAGTPAGGSIESPVEPPAHALAWREGRNFGLIIAHPAGRMLIQGGGFVNGSLDGEVVDVALIGTTGQARLGPEYQEDYWQNVVVATGARRVIPVHWDDFTRPLDQGLAPFPRWISDFDQAMTDLLGRAHRDGIEVRMLPAVQPVDPFFGLGSGT